MQQKAGGRDAIKQRQLLKEPPLNIEHLPTRIQRGNLNCCAPCPPACLPMPPPTACGMPAPCTPFCPPPFFCPQPCSPCYPMCYPPPCTPFPCCQPCCPPPQCPPPCQPCCQPPPCQPCCQPPPCCTPCCKPKCPPPCPPKGSPCAPKCCPPCPPPCCPCPPKCCTPCCCGPKQIVCIPKQVKPCMKKCCEEKSKGCGNGGEGTPFDQPASYNNCNFYLSAIPKGMQDKFGSLLSNCGGGGKKTDECESESPETCDDYPDEDDEYCDGDYGPNTAAGDDRRFPPPAGYPGSNRMGWGGGEGGGYQSYGMRGSGGRQASRGGGSRPMYGSGGGARSRGRTAGDNYSDRGYGGGGRYNSGRGGRGDDPNKDVIWGNDPCINQDDDAYRHPEEYRDYHYDEQELTRQPDPYREGNYPVPAPHTYNKNVHPLRAPVVPPQPVGDGGSRNSGGGGSRGPYNQPSNNYGPAKHHKGIQNSSRNKRRNETSTNTSARSDPCDDPRRGKNRQQTHTGTNTHSRPGTPYRAAATQQTSNYNHSSQKRHAGNQYEDNCFQPPPKSGQKQKHQQVGKYGASGTGYDECQGQDYGNKSRSASPSPASRLNSRQKRDLSKNRTDDCIELPTPSDAYRPYNYSGATSTVAYSTTVASTERPFSAGASSARPFSAGASSTKGYYEECYEPSRNANRQKKNKNMNRGYSAPNLSRDDCSPPRQKSKKASKKQQDQYGGQGQAAAAYDQCQESYSYTGGAEKQQPVCLRPHARRLHRLCSITNQRSARLTDLAYQPNLSFKKPACPIRETIASILSKKPPADCKYHDKDIPMYHEYCMVPGTPGPNRYPLLTRGGEESRLPTTNAAERDRGVQKRGAKRKNHHRC